MTELEKQLADVLQRLSAQHAQDMRQQQQRIESLSAQVQRLAQQQTQLIEAYKTLAAKWNEEWGD